MRVEVLGGVERRRRWSRVDKMRIFPISQDHLRSLFDRCRLNPEIDVVSQIRALRLVRRKVRR